MGHYRVSKLEKLAHSYLSLSVPPVSHDIVILTNVRY